jgi:CRP/FNR family transcriptional activator FtrB
MTKIKAHARGLFHKPAGERDMRHKDIDTIREVKLLRDLSDDSLQPLLQGAFLQRFPAHVELIGEGQDPDFLHVILDGLVGIFASHGERETAVRVLTTQASFIAAAVLLDKPYLVSARALAPTRVLMLPAVSVRQIFMQDAAFARTLAYELATAYRGVVKELKNQKLRPGIERLANWLLSFDQESGGAGRFTLPFDKRTLASQLGMAPEVLSRSFATLQTHGVSIDGPVVSIADRAALRDIARPSRTIDDPAV